MASATADCLRDNGFGQQCAKEQERDMRFAAAAFAGKSAKECKGFEPGKPWPPEKPAGQ